jgi:hypothetical protein
MWKGPLSACEGSAFALTCGDTADHGQTSPIPWGHLLHLAFTFLRISLTFLLIRFCPLESLYLNLLCTA